MHGRIGQRLLHDVRRVEPRRQSGIQSKGDHPAQPCPMPVQKLVPGRFVALAGFRHQLVGIVT